MFKKIKKHDGGADVAFIVSACITHSPVERLTPLLGSKDKNLGNKEVLQLVKIYKPRLLQPHSQRNEKKLPAKKLFKVKKNHLTAKDKRILLLFYFIDFE